MNAHTVPAPVPVLKQQATAKGFPSAICKISALVCCAADIQDLCRLRKASGS
jgi:hypothetical protein